MAKSTEVTQQDLLIQKIDERIKSFLKIAERRDGGKYKVDGVQRNAAGMITTIKGSVDLPGAAGAASVSSDMYWNIEGKALSANNGLDLITNEKLK